MKDTLEFSIITLTYQNPEEFDKFLISVINAEKPGNFELIVVDDSPDKKNDEIIKNYQNKININFVKLKKKSFISEKRNIGVSRARHELLFFVDSDIILEKNALSVLIKTARENPQSAMFGGAIMQDSNQLHPTKQDRLLSIKDNTFYCEVLYSAYLAFYKSAFSKVGGYDTIFENRGEGTDLSIKFWRGGFPILRDLNSIVHHPAFKTQRKSPERIAEMYRSLFLVGYKYNIQLEKNPHFIEMYQEREAAYGEACEFYTIYTFKLYYEWFCKNYRRIKDSQKNIPSLYDFKPFDIFTDKKLLEDCLASAEDRIRPFYKKVFGG